MSYDLMFWRGALPDDPAVLLHKLSRGQGIEQVEPLDRDHVAQAFTDAFEGDLEVVRSPDGSVTAIHGPLFSLELLAGEVCYLYVTCSWSITNRQDVMDRIISAGYDGLHCHAYNPQVETVLPQPDLDTPVADEG